MLLDRAGDTSDDVRLAAVQALGRAAVEDPPFLAVLLDHVRKDKRSEILFPDWATILSDNPVDSVSLRPSDRARKPHSDRIRDVAVRIVTCRREFEPAELPQIGNDGDII
jgi:hypothetical protein